MDYDAPGSHAGSTRATAICMIALTTVSIALRFWARAASKHAGLWWDDWLALVAWVFAVIECSFAFPLTANGLGQHVGHLSDYQLHRVLYFVYIQEFFYNFALTFVKLSAILFYVRIFTMNKKWFRWTVYVALGLSLAWMTYTTFLGAFQCTPAEKAWNPDMDGHCISETAAYVATAAPNVVIDLLLLLMPMPFLRSLHTSKGRKFGLLLVFILGYCVPIISIVRTIQASLLTETKFEDFTWYTNPTAILFYIEAGVGVISICLPAEVYLVRILIKHVPQRLRPTLLTERSMSINGRHGAKMGPCADPHETSQLPWLGYPHAAPPSYASAAGDVWPETASEQTTQRPSEETQDHIRR